MHALLYLFYISCTVPAVLYEVYVLYSHYSILYIDYIYSIYTVNLHFTIYSSLYLSYPIYYSHNIHIYSFIYCIPIYPSIHNYVISVSIYRGCLYILFHSLYTLYSFIAIQ